MHLIFISVGYEVAEAVTSVYAKLDINYFQSVPYIRRSNCRLQFSSQRSQLSRQSNTPFC